MGFLAANFMKPVYGKILVKVNHAQKETALIHGVPFSMPLKYMSNHREKNPVVCEVVEGNKELQAGTFLLVHHNRFVEFSPHHAGEDYYSLPYNENIFCIIDLEGEPKPIGGNIICERVRKEKYAGLDIPPSLVKPYFDRVIVKTDGYGFKQGDEVFNIPYADYEIIYNWNGVEKRAIKIYYKDIVGVLRKN